jgi:hypothetical protein
MRRSPGTGPVAPLGQIDLTLHGRRWREAGGLAEARSSANRDDNDACLALMGAAVAIRTRIDGPESG